MISYELSTKYYGSLKTIYLMVHPGNFLLIIKKEYVSSLLFTFHIRRRPLQFSWFFIKQSNFYQKQIQLSVVIRESLMALIV